MAASTAPNGMTFLRWRRNGVDVTQALTHLQTLAADYTLTAVYQGTLTTNPPMRRSLSINSSYFKKLYTNTQIADVGLETMQGYSFFSHKLEGLLPQKNKVRVAVRSATLLVNWQVSLAFEVAYHELGHGTRVGAYGYKYKFGGAITDEKDEQSGFFQLYGRLLRSGGLKAASVRRYDSQFEPAER